MSKRKRLLLEISEFDLRPNEPAFLLREVQAPAPDFRGKHRYQCIAIVRNDRLVRWVKDMGPWEAYPNKEVNVIGGNFDAAPFEVWETVATIQATADDIRNAPEVDPWPELLTPTTDDYNNFFEDEQDRRDRLTSGRKTIGTSPKGK